MYWRLDINDPYMKIFSKIKTILARGGFLSESGFTILEVAVVGAIIATLSVILIINFRSSSSNLTGRNQAVATIVGDIRRAQSMATSSSIYVDQAGVSHTVCGFGIHYSGYNTDYQNFLVNGDPSEPGNSYLIYAKLKPGVNESSSCSTVLNHNYVNTKNSADFVVQTVIMSNPNFEMAIPVCNSSGSSFKDIFFEPPNPKTYIDNDPALLGPNTPTLITVRLKGYGPNECPSNVYTNITINSSGSIDVQTY